MPGITGSPGYTRSHITTEFTWLSYSAVHSEASSPPEMPSNGVDLVSGVVILSGAGAGGAGASLEKRTGVESIVRRGRPASTGTKRDVMSQEPEELAEPEWNGPRCISCRRPMKHGVRFCVSCGRHNFDSDQLVGQSLASQAEDHLRNRAALENMNALWPSWFLRWWYWFIR